MGETIKNIELKPISNITLNDNSVGNDINERFENINSNFTKIIQAEYLRGAKGDSVTTRVITLYSDDNIEEIDDEELIEQKIKGYELYNIFARLIFGEDYTDKIDRLMHLNQSKVIVMYDEANSKQISSFPYVFHDPISTNVGAPENYKDYSCVIYFDNNAGKYVKEETIPTIYYDADRKDFCWKINGIKTQIVAKGPEGIGLPGTGILVAKYKIDADNKNYILTHILHSFDGDSNIDDKDYIPANLNDSNIDEVDKNKFQQLLNDLPLQDNSLVFARDEEAFKKMENGETDNNDKLQPWRWGLLKIQSPQDGEMYNTYKFLLGGNLSVFFDIGGKTLEELMKDNTYLYIANKGDNTAGHKLITDDNNALNIGPVKDVNSNFDAESIKESKFISNYSSNVFKGDIEVDGTIKGKVNGKTTQAETAETAKKATQADRLSRECQISLSGGAHSWNTGFDGSSDIKINVNSLNEQKLKWDALRKDGGKYDPTFTPIDTALGDHTNANRFSFLHPDLITVEYSTNGGNSWNNYWVVSEEVTQEMINKYKQSLVTTGLSNNIYPGKKPSGQTNNDKVRVSINAPAYISGQAGSEKTIYAQLRKLMIHVSGADGNFSTVDLKTIFKNTGDIITTNHKLQGFPGWNAIPFDYNFGGYEQSPDSHVIQIVLTFNGNENCSGMKINNITAHGDYLYVNNSGCNLAETGHVYKWDVDKNTIFPGDVIAPKHITAGGTNQQVVLGDGSLKNLSEIGGSGGSSGSGGNSGEPNNGLIDGGILNELTVQNLHVNNIKGTNGSNSLNKLDVSQLDTGNITNRGSIKTNHIEAESDMSSYNMSSYNMVIGNELCLNNYYDNTDEQIDHSYLKIYPPIDNNINAPMFEWHYSDEGASGESTSKTITVTYAEFFLNICKKSF